MHTRYVHFVYALTMLSAMVAFPVIGEGSDPDDKTGWTAPLAELGINGTVEHLAKPHHWTTKQISSYDRTGGNADDSYGHQVYDGGVVLADVEGPGMISRIWTKNPQGTIYIYVDDMEHPLIIQTFVDLFRGDLEYKSHGYSLFSPPFVGEGSGGYYCYMPIPYAQRCRIIVTENTDPLAYQVTYLEFPNGTPIKPFELRLKSDDVSYFKNWQKDWDAKNYRRHNRKTEKIHHSRHKYFPDTNTVAYPIVGPGVITELEMRVEGADIDVLDNVWIAVFFDDQTEPGVLAPIGDFFGSAVREPADADGLVLGRDGTRMWCRYPMPFNENAEIRFVNTSEQIADIEYFVTWREGEIGDQHYFFARYNQDVTSEGEPFVVADLSGDGHFVGATISAEGANSLTFLEGDDRYLVDGRPASEFHGTGTDDYFNAGWYFASGTSSDATHGSVAKISKAPAGFAAFRSHVTEPVPFKNSFTFELEHGESNNAPGVTYSNVAYWYLNNAHQESWLTPDFAYKNHLARNTD